MSDKPEQHDEAETAIEDMSVDQHLADLRGDESPDVDEIAPEDMSPDDHLTQIRKENR